MYYSSFSAEMPPLKKRKTSNDGVGVKRDRVTFTSGQLYELEWEYSNCKFVGRQKRYDLARKLNLTEANVKVWFQNRRANDKKAKNPAATTTIKTEDQVTDYFQDVNCPKILKVEEIYYIYHNQHQFLQTQQLYQFDSSSASSNFLYASQLDLQPLQGEAVNKVELMEPICIVEELAPAQYDPLVALEKDVEAIFKNEEKWYQQDYYAKPATSPEKINNQWMSYQCPEVEFTKDYLESQLDNCFAECSSEDLSFVIKEIVNQFVQREESCDLKSAVNW